MLNILSVKGSVCATDGFFADGIFAGLKKSGLDLGFVYSKTPCIWAGVFTSNTFKAAPIIHALQNKDKKINAILVNSKNANALTGDEGLANINEILGSLEGNWLMSSTGVIGEQLNTQKIKSAIKGFDFTQKNHENFSKCILTTDSFEKSVAFECHVGAEKFTLGAVAKGAGMIAPSLATMLCFVTTDINLEQAVLQECLQEAMEHSFNAISVDGDMSTNDSVIVMTNQKSSVNDKNAFLEALKMALHKLALDIVKDGEGAKKLVAFCIKGAKTKADAKRAGAFLSRSLLVKTALFGEDPNWGRIAASIGASGVECCEKKLKISVNDVVLYDKQITMTKEIEQKAKAVLQQAEFKITCELNQGREEFTSYGCDLGYDYVKINADYRT